MPIARIMFVQFCELSGTSNPRLLLQGFPPKFWVMGSVTLTYGSISLSVYRDEKNTRGYVASSCNVHHRQLGLGITQPLSVFTDPTWDFTSQHSQQTWYLVGMLYFDMSAWWCSGRLMCWHASSVKFPWHRGQILFNHCQQPDGYGFQKLAFFPRVGTTRPDHASQLLWWVVWVPLSVL